MLKVEDLPDLLQQFKSDNYYSYSQIIFIFANRLMNTQI